MIPLRDNQSRESFPLLTWTLVALNVGIYLWDRHGRVFGPSLVFADLAMRPDEVLKALMGKSAATSLVTLFTSLFLHANLMHLIGNMLFLVVFGSGIEEALSPWRYALYYIFWGLVASSAHIYVNPDSSVSTLGASGAIGGVLGAYFLLFPGNKIEIFVPILAFLSFTASAWMLLGLWFLWQILVPQEGVANWAHAGGFLAGMVTVLIMGGRGQVLKDRPDLAEATTFGMD